MTRRPWFDGFVLFLGAALVALAGSRHPMLTGDGATQLGVIAATPGWRLIHWVIAFGYVLVIAGLTGVWSRLAPSPGVTAARAGMFLSLFGYLADLIGVLFMLGAASTLADAYRAGDPGLAATHAVFVFDMLHPAARAALRIAAFAVSLGLVGFGWGILGGAVLPRWLGWLGTAGGVAGAAIAVILPASATYVIAGVAIATVWQLATGLVLLARRAD